MPLGWWDRLQAQFDAWLGSLEFRRFAAAFPLTRPIARRRARALFDLCAGFVYSQILLACVRLRVFDHLAKGPQTAAQLAPRLGLTPDACVRLLDAGVALRLVSRRRGERYALGALGATLVGNEAVLAMIEHHALVYGDLHDPVALLRQRPQDSALARYWAYSPSAEPAALASPQVADYSSLMSASQSLVADQVLDAYSLRRHRVLLDVGGGEGRFLGAAAQRWPHLHLMLFDLPPVVERASPWLAAQGLSNRVSTYGGSFLHEELPRGADLISLVRVLHDHDDDAAVRILGAARRALPAGGRLLVAEPMSRTPGAETVGDAYFGFYLLAMGRGRPRSAERLTELLIQAGFCAARPFSTHLPIQTRVLVADVANG